MLPVLCLTKVFILHKRHKEKESRANAYWQRSQNNEEWYATVDHLRATVGWEYWVREFIKFQYTPLPQEVLPNCCMSLEIQLSRVALCV